MAKRRSKRRSTRRTPTRRKTARSAPPPPAAPAGPPPASDAPPTPPPSGQDPRYGSPWQAPLASDKLPPRERLHRDMLRSIVTEPLLTKVQNDPAGSFDVIIVLNELFEGGIDAALQQVKTRAEAWHVKGWTSTSHYVFARLTGKEVLALSAEARELMARGKTLSVVYRIWEDNDVETTLTRSLTTIKADAAQRAFAALGHEIVWAVLDSGVEKTHPHFTSLPGRSDPIDALSPAVPLEHLDFTPDGLDASGSPTTTRAAVDRLGHGTHVAGIIAGAWESPDGQPKPVVGTEMRDESASGSVPSLQSLTRITGVAPHCKVVSLKVVADTTLTGTIQQKAGQGKVSWLLRAIDKIQEWNQHGKRLLIHGVNMSLGYEFDARWFGCGQSPLCIEVNRLVKSGVVVVVSAGNAGYPTFVLAGGRTESRYTDHSITDPGNADLAITVGSTHRDSPHLYGVSYFSSRGPTGDGRRKPDLLAPGERIWSCAAGLEAQKYAVVAGTAGTTTQVLYLEQTGTSMAAPHVSGAVAAFLSVRREFIGQPERVKEIVLQAAVDLRRERYVQGAGLLDLMKMLQLV